MRRKETILFDDFFGADMNSFFSTQIPKFKHDGKDYVAEFEFAGVKRGDVKVFREGLRLTVMWLTRLGENKTESHDFPGGSRLQDAVATFKDGLLTVRVPYAAPPKNPPRIEIPVSEG